MMTQKEIDAERVIKAIADYRGNLSAVAKLIGCSRGTLYMFIKNHATCQKAVEEARETAIDNVETVLYSKAMDGESWAVSFFLKMQGKHRGYVERTDITSGDKPIHVVGIGADVNKL